MKLQIFILAIGIAVSAGAVEAELNRASHSAITSQSVSAPISASQSSLKQSTTPAATTTPTLLNGVKPSIKGGNLGDD